MREDQIHSAGTKNKSGSQQAHAEPTHYVDQNCTSRPASTQIGHPYPKPILPPPRNRVAHVTESPTWRQPPAVPDRAKLDRPLPFSRPNYLLTAGSRITRPVAESLIWFGRNLSFHR